MCTLDIIDDQNKKQAGNTKPAEFFPVLKPYSPAGDWLQV
jgi:hypothetical protein